MYRWLLFLLCCFQSIYAQNTASLAEILKNLSKDHNLVFSYKSSDIETFSEIQLPKNTDLDSVILALEKQTKLTFEKIDLNNYVISRIALNEYIFVGCGIVTDSWNNPLPNVAVSVKKKSTITNADGAFHIALNDTIRSNIQFVMNGFAPISLPVSYFRNDCKTIVLKQKTTALKEIVISNYMTRGMTKKENSSIEINLAKTGLLPGVIEPDILQSIQFIPGVLSPDETVSGLHIRGSTPDQNLVLFDGTKVYQDAHFFGLISAFNPYVIDNIQLFRSATKAKYGGHAGGVLSINADSKIPEKASAGLGSTFTHSDAFAKIPLLKDKLALFVSLRRSITDFSNNITFREYSNVAFQNTDILGGIDNTSDRISDTQNVFFYQDYFSKLIYQPSEKLKFNFAFVGNLNNLSFKGIDNFIDTDFEDTIKIENLIANGNIEYNDPIIGTHSLQVSTTSYDKNYDGLNQFDPNSQTPTLLEITFSKENFVKETSINYIGKKNLFKNGQLEFGFQRSRSEIGYTVENFGVDFTTFKESLIGNETSQSYFTDFEYKSKKIKSSIGLRRQYFNRLNATFWEPRLFVNYKLLDKLWLKGSFEKKHQSISQITDLRNDGLGNLFDKLWVVSTPEDVSILKNTQATVGIDFQNKGWTLDIEAYTKELDGIGILLTNDIANPENVIGSNSVKGVDLLIKKQWNFYQTWISYSYSESKYQFEAINNNIPFDGSFDTPHNFVWTHSLNYKNMELSLGYRYHSGIPFTNKSLNDNTSQASTVVFENFNAERLPDYQRLDLSGSYKFHLDKAKKVKARFGFTLQNLANNKSFLSRDFRAVESNNPNNSSGNRIISLQKADRRALGLVPNFIFRINI